MSIERFRPYAAVYAILLRGGNIFMLRRVDSWKNGYWGIPAGHIEGEESMTQAIIREAKEEACVDIDPEDLSFAHVAHRISRGDREYVDFYFVSTNWKGEPAVGEKDKASEAAWFPIDALPENTIESVAAAIDKYRAGISYSEYGWDGEI